MSLERALWIFNRLRAMGPREILWRCRNELLAIFWSRGLLTASDPPAPELTGDGLVQLIVDPAQFERSDVLETADSLIADGMDLFQLSGVECVNPQWNRDPLSGITAPAAFGLKMNFKDTELCGYIKYLWEPARFLQAVPLALAWNLSAEMKYLRAVRSMLESWLEQCPYLRGPHWSSPLEAAIRLINWALAWQLAGGADSPLFAGDSGRSLRKRFLRSVYQHIHFINSWYSRGSSANNHLIGEAAGVFIGCSVWPYWADCKGWKELARVILETEVGEQIAPDGVGREQTLSYQQFVLDFLALSRLHEPGCFSAEYHAVLQKMSTFIAAMNDGYGNKPMIGDADDGMVSGFSLLPGGGPVWTEVSGGQLPDVFSDGGYAIFRDRAAGLFMVIDGGPLGYGTLAAHGHADALALYLSVGGREFFIDPGTYTYGADPFWRNYFRGTSAHNTVTVDGLDQSVSGGPFLWTEHAHSRFSVERGEVYDVFQGSHEGYLRLDDPLEHERKVTLLCAERRIVVHDILSCSGEHLAEQFWHFSEECSVEIIERNRVRAENGGQRITMEFGSEVRIELYRGNEERPLGWVSRRFGVRIPSSTVVAAVDLSRNMELVTEIRY